MTAASSSLRASSRPRARSIWSRSATTSTMSTNCGTSRRRAASSISMATPRCRRAPGKRSCAASAARSRPPKRSSSGKHANAFVATRPPGHHAETNRPMGFCFFDHAAIAARHAQRKHGIARAAVVDFDVHHGNGTQEIFWADPTVMYCSTHQMPLFPGTGASRRTRRARQHRQRPARVRRRQRQIPRRVREPILPQLTKFSPELMIISAGFDAHYRDPLASLNLRAEDFGWVTRKLMEVAETSAGGRMVSVLEGGYDLQGLREVRGGACHRIDGRGESAATIRPQTRSNHRTAHPGTRYGRKHTKQTSRS